MPLAIVTCPHCQATLRPARPVAEGKSVTCPKCQRPFKAGEEPAAGPKPAAAKKGDKKPAKPAAPAPAIAQDEDEGGTYAVVKEPEPEPPPRARKKASDDDEEEDDEDEEEVDEEEEDSITNQYLKSLKSADPRGPAQAAVVAPSNWLLRSGLAGFFGWWIVFIVFLIPIVFPIVEKEDTTGYSKLEEKDKEKQKASGGSSGDRATPYGILRSIPDDSLNVVLFVLVLILGIAHSALICVGAVKMVSLESRTWGIVAAVLAILPLHIVPMFALEWTIFDFLFEEMAWIIAAVSFVGGPLVGAYVLSVLNRPEIKEGYEFKPK